MSKKPVRIAADILAECPDVSPTAEQLHFRNMQLGTIEQVIYDRLREAENNEQPILTLFCAAFDVRHADRPKKSRLQQQRLGPYIARLNRKLDPVEHIKPGEARRTYRLRPGPLPPEDFEESAPAEG